MHYLQLLFRDTFVPLQSGTVSRNGSLDGEPDYEEYSNLQQIPQTKSGEKVNENNSAITVYFADKGEKLWDIAKRFGTSVDAVCRRNA